MKGRGKRPTPPPCAGAVRVEQGPEIKHDGATIAFRLMLATSQTPAEAHEEVAEAISQGGAYLTCCYVEGRGQAKSEKGEIMPALSIVGVVNTPETDQQVYDRAILPKRATQKAWISAQWQAVPLPPAAATAAWAQFWENVKNEVHRPSEDGKSIRVVVPGNGPRGQA